jgi:hypothetical protein
MPSVSKKQHDFMAAIAHSPEFAKKVGIKPSVGKHFMEADKGKKFKEGGMMKHDDIAEDKKLIKRAFGMHDKQEHPGKHTDLSKLKKGGIAMKKMAKGGMAKETMGPRTMAMDVEKGSNIKAKFGESKVQKTGHTRGKNLGDSGKTMPPKMMASGGMAGPYRKAADGITMKGKTKGKQIKMKSGGMC